MLSIISAKDQEPAEAFDLQQADACIRLQLWSGVRTLPAITLLHYICQCVHTCMLYMQKASKTKVMTQLVQ